MPAGTPGHRTAVEPDHIELTITHNFADPAGPPKPAPRKTGETAAKAAERLVRVAAWEAAASARASDLALTRQLWIEGRIGIRWVRRDPVPSAEELDGLLNRPERLADAEFTRALSTIWNLSPGDLAQMRLLHALARDGGAAIAA